jgi:hypothetical protein
MIVHDACVHVHYRSVFPALFCGVFSQRLTKISIPLPLHHQDLLAQKMLQYV